MTTPVQMKVAMRIVMSEAPKLTKTLTNDSAGESKPMDELVLQPLTEEVEAQRQQVELETQLQTNDEEEIADHELNSMVGH